MTSPPRRDPPARPSAGGPAPGTGVPAPTLGRAEALRRFPELAEAWDAAAARFPVRLPRAWIEGGHPALLRQALPSAEELAADPGDREDPVGDALRSPVPWVVHKHPDRVLLLLTKQCHLYCRYCFRRNHRPGEGEQPTPAEWERMLDYAARSGAREVILSGGDPLALPDRRLFEAMDRLRPEIPVIRVHTRAPVTWPQRVGEGLVRGLRERAPVWVVVHTNHPAELSTEVRVALGRLVDAGLPVLNQAVLLAGVNDDVDTLVALCEELVALRVFPYYLHHPDPAPGNAHFRVSVERGLALHEALRRRVSGLALPTYVEDPPDGTGKRAVTAG